MNKGTGGESRIPTVRRSGLPRPAPPQLRVGAPFSLQGGSGPFSLSPTTHDLPIAPQPHRNPHKIARYSTGDLGETGCVPRRNPSRPVSSGGRLVHGDIGYGVERAWALATAQDSAFSRQLARVTQPYDDEDEEEEEEIQAHTLPDACHPRIAHTHPWSDIPGSSVQDNALSRESVGRRVLVGGAEGGVLRYLGRTAFANGLWAGVELDTPVGKNDGSVDGVIYFSCHPRHGIFAPVSRVSLAHTGVPPPFPGPSHAAQASISSKPSVDSSPECGDVVGSPGSAGDATCDDSSLGILTPDQMPDFTVTASASLGRSPSDEDVAALEDEVCEGGAVGGAVGGAGVSAGNVGMPSGVRRDSKGLPRWDSDPVESLDVELFRSDVSAIIRELRSSAEGTTSSGGSSPSRPRPSPDTERFQRDEERLEQEDDEDRAAHTHTHSHPDGTSAEATGEVHACPPLPEPRDVPGGVDLARLPAVARRAAPLTTRLLLATSGNDLPEADTTWPSGVVSVSVVGGVVNVVGGAAMTTSAGSLDQGYQGDAECDPRSEGGTGTASSPTEDVRLFQGIDVEGDVSLEDDHEAEHHGPHITRGDRSARIIDGKLYHAPRELARPHDPNTSEMDSSGFYSDLDPRDRDPEDESARTDLEPVQEALGYGGSAQDSLMEDSRLSLHDSLLDDDTRADHSLEEDRSSASTLRAESKDPTLSESNDIHELANHNTNPNLKIHDQSVTALNATPKLTDITLADTNPELKVTDPILADLSDAKTTNPTLTNPEILTLTSPNTANPKTDSAITSFNPSHDTVQTNPDQEIHEGTMTDSNPNLKSNTETSSLSPPPQDTANSALPVTAEDEDSVKLRPRTYDKPWLARAPLKRKEEPRRALPPPPSMPKRNVQSKLKALIEAPREPAAEDARRRLKKNRWDEVMNKIAEGQKEAPRGPPKEVKSRLMEGVLAPAATLSPQAERIRQERRERRERRQAAAAAASAAAASVRRPMHPRGDRKRSTASIRSNRTSRAPSLDSLPADSSYSRGSSLDRSETSHRSGSSGGGASRGSRDSRGLSTSSNPTLLPPRSSTCSTSTINLTDKKRLDPSLGTPSPPLVHARRPRIDTLKSISAKTTRPAPRKTTDPVKPQGRPGLNHLPQSTPQHRGQGGTIANGFGANRLCCSAKDQNIRKLQTEVNAKVEEVKLVKEEKLEVNKALEAITVLFHHLAVTYDAFSTPRLKKEVRQLGSELTETRLSLDESLVSLRRLQDEEEEARRRRKEELEEVEMKNKMKIEQITQEHREELEAALEKHRKEMSKFAEEQQAQREEVSRAHTAEVEQLEGEWRTKIDLQHERHLCALQELNTKHNQQVRELESAKKARERELEEANERLEEERKTLRRESRKLEETLMSDTDHRLSALRNMCSSLKSEVESLKSVVDMKTSEIHSLRSQVAEIGRLSSDLETARERGRALQAKTEDLQAQMDKKTQMERSLVNEHRLLVETYQRESSVNKRLSLENEELAWKLRQREEKFMSISTPAVATTTAATSTGGGGGGSVELPSRSSAISRSNTPLNTPRAQRVSRSCVSPCKSEPSSRRKYRCSSSSSGGLEVGPGSSGGSGNPGIDSASPPTSPCVKAVVEKSNSVSFILDLTGDLSELPDAPVSPRRRPHRTASLSAADRPRTTAHPHAQARRTQRPNTQSRIRANTLDRTNDLKTTNRGRSESESSESASPVNSASPTPSGLAWTVPVCAVTQKSTRHPTARHLIQDQEEDEYECGNVQPRFLEGPGLISSSENASDSELSQCSLKGNSDTDSESTDQSADIQANAGTEAQKIYPKLGAGEAMVPEDIFGTYPEIPTATHQSGARRRFPPPSSTPSSDDDNTTPHNEDDDDDVPGKGDVSWDDCDVDVTSSSELHDDL